MQKLVHICEKCGRTELLTPDEAFDAGWDYPPRMGQFKIVSPRTCPCCGVEGTAWWKLVVEKVDPHALAPHDLEVIERILNEPESITPTDTPAENANKPLDWPPRRKKRRRE